MRSTLALARSFDRPVKLLLVNQLTINTGFYMLMPYLAGHLSGALALPAALVGLILGIRNLSQQGMFLIGGTLADRLGHKPMIIAGCGLRTLAFLMLAVADSLPMLVTASALTGFAGALFNPAVRAYLAQEAGARKVEAFAAFNAFYQLGILIGPLVGLLLNAVAFRLVCLVAGVMFAVLTIAQLRALPKGERPRTEDSRGVLLDWREVIGNRPFLLFSLAMIGSYVLNFQVYLGLPLEIRRMTSGELGVTLVFVVSAVMTIAGQARLTAWATRRWRPPQAIARGLVLMGFAFTPLALAAPWAGNAGHSGGVAGVLVLLPVLGTAVLLSLATMIIYPFEMATIATFGGRHMVGTYYGLYSTLAGIGIAAGNLLTGWALDLGARTGLPSLPWLALALIGLGCAAAVAALDRSGRLATSPQTAPAPA
ncbi:MFS transporter [Streptosporangium sp. NBC_01755]|uniref:MFS transporter n=1 Tax=unclassified Streptosporangium TaxID=2632669 RepID=UPI002DD8CE03|nr:MULTISPECIES: MFS transporter [unclassified Streptosporangium]WSA24962.1 MFS transporter [Streptosporangium sp. NBC_01810]WSD03706.1 MFS transporter [Streptosporangium sp. NBC_01755]